MVRQEVPLREGRRTVGLEPDPGRAPRRNTRDQVAVDPAARARRTDRRARCAARHHRPLGNEGPCGGLLSHLAEVEALMLEQPALARQTAAIAGERTVGTD